MNYSISSYSFRGNYSFLNLEIQSSQYKRPKVIVHKGAETIQGRKRYEEIRYAKFLWDSRKNCFLTEYKIKLKYIQALNAIY